MKSTSSTLQSSTGAWTLEVIRGARVGQRYPVGADSLLLGSGLAATNGEAFLCLADQEGTSLRKMAARHLEIKVRDAALHLTDLNTPGGTFVNNRRLLAGTSVTLAEGDIVQLGAVQLRLTRSVAAPAADPLPRPVVASFHYATSGSGAVCRTWDDFLPLSAQKWDELRADLLTGRLAEFVTSIGRPDLAPAPVRGNLPTDEADERLNAWLGRLPTRTAATPELEIHPRRLVVGVSSGGVTVVRKFRVANVGYGLLRARVQVERATGAQFTIEPRFAGTEFVVRDSVEIPIEIAVPNPFNSPGSAELRVSSSDTEQRIAIQVERKVLTSEEPFGAREVDSALIAGPLARFRELAVGKRVTIAALVGLSSRLLIGLAGGAIGEDSLLASGPEIPHLGGVVVAFALTGAGLGGWWLARWGGKADLGVGATAGAGLGTLLASAAVAFCRAVEPVLALSALMAIAFWTLSGGVIGGLVPSANPKREEPAR